MNPTNDSNSTAGNAPAFTPRPRYIAASLPAWRDAAAQAIAKGQTEDAFLGTCHPDNRGNACTAYRMARAAIAKATGNA
jgi:hypothetical protein